MAGPGLTPRRGFLARLIAGVATLSAAPGAVAGQSDTRQGTSARWDDSWTARVTGRHRAVFDIPEIKGGTVGLFRSGMWMDNYAEMYGVKDQDLSPVVVIRHAAVPMFMNDEFWDAYGYREEYASVLEDMPKGESGNPFRKQSFGRQDFGIDPLQTRGAIILGCGVAFRRIVGDVMKKDNVAMPDAEAKARAHILPGVALQPSGIFAVARAQDLGCSYVWAT
jgi:hypothetical protein